MPPPPCLLLAYTYPPITLASAPMLASSIPVCSADAGCILSTGCKVHVCACSCRCLFLALATHTTVSAFRARLSRTSAIISNVGAVNRGASASGDRNPGAAQPNPRTRGGGTKPCFEDCRDAALQDRPRPRPRHATIWATRL